AHAEFDSKTTRDDNFRLPNYSRNFELRSRAWRFVVVGGETFPWSWRTRFFFSQRKIIFSIPIVLPFVCKSWYNVGWLPDAEDDQASDQWSDGREPKVGARACGWLEYRSLCCEASMEGQLEVMKWAKAQGCPWDDHTVYFYIMQRGHLHVVKWKK